MGSFRLCHLDCSFAADCSYLGAFGLACRERRSSPPLPGGTAGSWAAGAGAAGQAEAEAGPSSGTREPLPMRPAHMQAGQYRGQEMAPVEGLPCRVGAAGQGAGAAAAACCVPPWCPAS